MSVAPDTAEHRAVPVRAPVTRARRARPRAILARLLRPGWRGVVAGPLVALVTLVAALVTAGIAGVPVRDPDHVAAGYVAMVGGAVIVLIGLDVLLRARRRTGSPRPSREALRQVRRERWTRSRGLAVGAALVSFYVTYMAYRNLKGVVPLLRPGDLFDRSLAEFDRVLFGGNDPATLLHDLFGTGIAAHVFSTAYVAFIVFLPLSLALALVFSRELHGSLFYASALSINWVLGAASYFVLPSLGPAFADPGAFAALPHTEVTHLQAVLLDQRQAFLHAPATAVPQSIAAFASLHISMSFTALAGAHLLGLSPRVKTPLWVWFGLTCVGTIYLGWHYVVDDLAGIAIGAAALAAARMLTGLDLRAARARVRAPLPASV